MDKFQIGDLIRKARESENQEGPEPESQITRKPDNQKAGLPESQIDIRSSVQEPEKKEHPTEPEKTNQKNRKGKNQKASLPESQITRKPDNQITGLPESQIDLEKKVNLTVKVPESLRRHWAAESKRQGVTMTDVMVEALINRFGEPN